MHTVDLPKLQQLESASGSLEYAIFCINEGKPLLLVLHGLGGNAHSIKHVAPLLHKEYSVVGVSLPFHGNTWINSPLKAAYPGFVELLLQLISQLKNELKHSFCSICAHSIGAIFAIQTAVIAPTSIKNLFLVAPAGFGTNDKLFFTFCQHAVGKWLLSQDLFLRYFSQKLWKTDDLFARRIFMNQLKQFFLAISEFDLVATNKMHLLYSVSAQVNIFWGKDDPILPYQYATEVANHFQRSQINMLNDGGHNLLKTRPQYLAEQLIKLA